MYGESVEMSTETIAVGVMVETKLGDLIIFWSTFVRAQELSLLQRKTWLIGNGPTHDPIRTFMKAQKCFVTEKTFTLWLEMT